jgi:hypothetical protein
MILKGPCHHCGGNIEFDDSHLGEVHPCPHCEQPTELGAERAIPTSFLPRSVPSPVKYSASKLLGYCIGVLIFGVLVAGLYVQQGPHRRAKQYLKAAEQGNAKAQNSLGDCYQTGKGVPWDLAEGARWYRKSAEQGNIDGQSSLGACYEFGLGVIVDGTEAAKWYRKSAEQGNTIAQRYLGLLYTSGTPLPKNFAEAVKWFRMAAEQGDVFAQMGLGRCYEQGEGVERNITEAYKWMSLSAAQGDMLAPSGVLRVQTQMTAEQIAEAQRLIREFKPIKFLAPTGPFSPP